MTDAPANDDETDDLKDKAFVTDAEIVRMLGLPRDLGRVAIQTLSANPLSGFPKKHALFGGRRYRKAVEDYFEKHYRPIMEPSSGERRKVHG